MKRIIILLVALISLFYTQAQTIVQDSTSQFKLPLSAGSFVFDKNTARIWQITQKATATNTLETTAKREVTSKYALIDSVLQLRHDISDSIASIYSYWKTKPMDAGNYNRYLTVNSTDIRGISVFGGQLKDGATGLAAYYSTIRINSHGFAINNSLLDSVSIGFVANNSTISNGSGGVSINDGIIRSGSHGFAINSSRLDTTSVGFVAKNSTISNGSGGVSINDGIIRSGSHGFAINNGKIENTASGIAITNSKIENSSYGFAINSSKIENSAHGIAITNSEIRYGSRGLAVDNATLTNGSTGFATKNSYLYNVNGISISSHDSLISTNHSSIVSSIAGINNKILYTSNHLNQSVLLGAAESNIINCNNFIGLNLQQKTYENLNNTTVIDENLMLPGILQKETDSVLYISGDSVYKGVIPQTSTKSIVTYRGQNMTSYRSAEPLHIYSFSSKTDNNNANSVTTGHTTYNNGSLIPFISPNSGLLITSVTLMAAQAAVSQSEVGAAPYVRVDLYSVEGTGRTLIESLQVPIININAIQTNNSGGGTTLVNATLDLAVPVSVVGGIMWGCEIVTQNSNNNQIYGMGKVQIMITGEIE
ncbi:MAG: hypothetical protein M0R02_09330 [Bacteroidales bacterium]|nr:hypothetical protein [Bacteroidales bacterium]